MSELLNFLDHRLLPKVKCDTPAMDNYEPENLLSANETIRGRGFFSYAVIKPPVSLTFDLICPVDISAISLYTSIGLQKCTGLEIFAKNSANPNFISICKAFYDSDGLVFCNSRHFSSANPPPSYNPHNQELFFLKRDTWRLFTSAESLKVVIFRTARCTPCIQSIKVFGKVARKCSTTTKATISKLVQEKVQQEVVKTKEFQIPEDFVDALTCEIMALPMTLPSGKTIDRDTLEKHVQCEESFGRKPGDPFTGLKFTESRKPVLNQALKSRIDLFLMQHCDHPKVVCVKRTLGSGLERSSKRARMGSDCKKCAGCEQSGILYQLPCIHLFCRTCLVKLDAKCNECKRDFLRKDVKCCNV